MQIKSKRLFGRRQSRVRHSIMRAAKNRPRLTVFRSSLHIYAQVIDAADGKILAAASTIDKALRPNLKTGANIAAAQAVGKLVAERGRSNGVSKVVFDRGGFAYHGRIASLADAAREAGLEF
jgi:large subunit ribosomal protein L18